MDAWDFKQAIEDYKIAAGLGHKKSQEFLRSQGVETVKITPPPPPPSTPPPAPLSAPPPLPPPPSARLSAQPTAPPPALASAPPSTPSSARPPAPPSALPSEQEIRQFLYRYINSYNNKSIESFIAFFSPKAIQNQKDDFEKIRKSYETFFNQMATIQYRVTIDEIKPQQNSAEVRGQYQLEGLVLKGKKKENWKGQVRWGLVREDGALKILTLDYQPQK